MPTVYGVDLGAHTVKLSVLEGSFGRYQVTDYRVRSVPQSVDERPDLARRVAALSDLMGELETERAQFAAAYPADKTSLRVVTLPFSEKAKIDQTLQFVVGDYVPFDMDESVLSYRILDVSPGESKVLTAIAPTDAVRARLEVLASAAVPPSSLAVDSDLLGGFADSGVQVVLDFGHERILAALAVDGEVMISRAITGGGRDLTLAIAEAAAVGFAEAEGRKHVADIAPDSLGAPAEAAWEDDDHTEPHADIPPDDTAVLLRALRPLLNDIRTTLINFEDTLRVEVDEVLLCGGGAQLAGLRTHLGEELGVPIRRVALPESAEQTVEPLRLALAHALGLKVAKMGGQKALDMRQGELSFQGDLANIGLALRAGALAAVAILVLGTGWFGYRYAQLSADLAASEALIAAEAQAAFPEMGDSVASDPARAVAVVAEETALASSRVDALGSILSDVPPTLELYRKVSKGVPDHKDARIDVSEMTITRTSITFKAETDGFEEATRVETALQSVEGFASAKKGDEKRDRQGNVDFSVTIPLGDTNEESG